MNQLLSRQHLYSHSQENRQVRQASIVLLHTIRVKVKVALLGAAILLIAAIISSCGGTSYNPTPTPTPTPSRNPTPTPTPIPVCSTPSPPVVYSCEIAKGFYSNTDTSNHQHGWLTERDGVLTLNYPAGQEWGTMFITVEQPALPGHRQSMDLSLYQSLAVDMRAETSGQCVRIGIKDAKQPDNGGETTIPWCSTTPNGWDTVKLPLEVFTRTDLTDVPADLTKLYVVFEVVFQGSSSVTLQVRNIRYSPEKVPLRLPPSSLTPVSSPFNVYTDAGAPENHYVPTGFMGDTKDITMREGWPKNPHRGATCIQVVYSGAASQGFGWAGVYWQAPPNNWGKALEPTGNNLSHLSQLSFWVRGDQGNERITFLVGGITGPYGDSLPAVSKTITLTTSWQLETIDLRGQDLTHVIGGFGWTANNTDNPQGATFYLDDIVFT